MAVLNNASDLKFVNALDWLEDSSGNAASNVVNGAAVDTSGFGGIITLVKFGATDDAWTIKMQSDSTSAFASALDVAGSAQTIAAGDSDVLVVADVKHPPERYLRLRMTPTSSGNADFTAVYILYNPDSLPVTSTASDTSGNSYCQVETNVWPGTGTA